MLIKGLLIGPHFHRVARHLWLHVHFTSHFFYVWHVIMYQCSYLSDTEPSNLFLGPLISTALVQSTVDKVLLTSYYSVVDWWNYFIEIFQLTWLGDGDEDEIWLRSRWLEICVIGKGDQIITDPGSNLLNDLHSCPLD